MTDSYTDSPHQVSKGCTISTVQSTVLGNVKAVCPTKFWSVSISQYCHYERNPITPLIFCPEILQIDKLVMNKQNKLEPGYNMVGEEEWFGYNMDTFWTPFSTAFHFSFL